MSGGTSVMGDDSVWVVIPSIDERRNLARLLPQLLELDLNLRCVVVDDGSTDGTRELLLGMTRREGRLESLFRERSGLGSALREGLAFALAHGATRVITMDADLSHDPSDIPRLLAVRADLVLGSRYVVGGGVVGRSRRRRAMSALANRMSRLSIRAKERDLTTGFRAYSHRMAAHIVQESTARGYEFEVEAVKLAKKHGLEVREVPITFRERHWGQSKISGPREGARLLGFLALQSSLGMLFLVGLVGALVYEFLLIALVGLFQLHYFVAALAATQAGLLTSLVLYERWTSRQRPVRRWVPRLSRYGGAVAVALMLNLFVLFLLTEYVNLVYLVSNVFGVGTALSWNYVAAFFLSSRF